MNILPSRPPPMAGQGLRWICELTYEGIMGCLIPSTIGPQPTAAIHFAKLIRASGYMLVVNIAWDSVLWK